jgi:steroid 5-alpha reductase family enzyme
MVAVMVSAWCLQSALARGNVVQPTIFSLKEGLFWLFLVVSVGLPIVLNAGQALPAWRMLFTVGYSVWALGYYAEFKAQLVWRQQAKKSKVAKHLPRESVWKYTEHPVYYAQIAQWLGIGLIASQTSYGWLGLISPLAIYLLPEVFKKPAKI